MAYHSQSNRKSDIKSNFPAVAVIVLTMNSERHVEECLQSLRLSTYPNLTIWVVDNGSTDRTLELVQHFQPGIRLLRLEQNIGFAAGNNRGIAATLTAGADFVMLLNDDTQMIPGCIEIMLKAIATDPNHIGMVAPALSAYYHPERIFVGGKIDPDTWGASETEMPNEFLPPVLDVDYASGCAWLVPADVIRKIGMFDERLYMYYEDVDWCLRCRRANKRIVVATQARVRHKGSGGGPASKSMNAYFYYQRNWVRIIRTYAPRRQAMRLILGIPAGLWRFTPSAPEAIPSPDVGIALLEGWVAGILRQSGPHRLKFPSWIKSLLSWLARHPRPTSSSLDKKASAGSTKQSK